MLRIQSNKQPKIPMIRIALLIVLVVSLGSCLKEPSLHSYQVKLIVDFGSDISPEKKAGAEVTLVNQQRNIKITGRTNDEGAIQFSSVELGFYSVSVVHSFASGIINYRYNGQKKIDVFDNKIDTIVVRSGIWSNFVIKEFYYSGSKTPAGKAYYADQYIELFNNTNEVQFADGISVLEHESSGTGVNLWASIPDTIVAQMIWSIPGNGTQYPVLPGQSIVIAQDGINHKDDPNGNPLSPVNLGDANFEYYVFSSANKDVDSPRIPNMVADYLSNNISEVTFRVQGGSAIAIAKLPGETAVERINYIQKHLVAKKSASGSSVAYYPKVANKYILDAVETVEDEAHAVYKRFSSEIDAGYIYIITGSYSGKCVRRKIKDVQNGRVIYQDTNNSANDFIKDAVPNPKVYE